MDETSSLGRWIRDAPPGGVEAKRALENLRRRLFERDIPSSVGRFEHLRLIGRGGMGVVYRGWDGLLGRSVALKFPRLDRTTAARVRQEALAMARVQHPNVVEIFDVGWFDDEPYIAMEFVDGQDLGTWLDAAPRSFEAILHVFAQAAQGLQAAHDLGVVHRDFKPANVLVGRDGRAVVADFGLATADASATGAGTPRFMAPEQLTGGAVGPWTDQWAFARALRDALPSARLRELEPALRRALDPAPGARFASMQDLLDALVAPPRSHPRRWAFALAVLLLLPASRAAIDSTTAHAAAPTMGTVVHRQTVALAREALQSGNIGHAKLLARDALSSAADDPGARAIAGVVLGRALVAAGELDGARPILEASFFDAGLAHRSAAALESAIVLIDVSNRLQAHDEADRWTRHALAWSDRADAPLLAADLALARAATARTRGELEASSDHVESAWALLARDAGHPRAHRVFNERGRTLLERGDYDAAAESFREAERAFVRAGRADHPARAVPLVNLGNAALYLDDLPTAGNAYDRAYQLRHRQFGSAHRETAIALMNLGIVDRLEGRLTEAQARLEKAVHDLRRALGPEHPDVALALGNLATVHGDLGEHERSISLNREAVSIFESAWGAEHPRIAHQRGNLAAALVAAGRSEDARAQYERAAQMARKTVGPSHPLTADLDSRLATLIDEGSS